MLGEETRNPKLPNRKSSYQVNNKLPRTRNRVYDSDASFREKQSGLPPVNKIAAKNTKVMQNMTQDYHNDRL